MFRVVAIQDNDVMNTQLLHQQHPWRPSFENSVDTAIRSEANQGLLRTREHGEAAFRRGNHYLVAKLP